MVAGHNFSVEDGKQVLTVDLPELESLQGVDLDIGTAEVRLEFPGGSPPLCIPLPSEKLQAASSPAAKFSRKRRQLTITWDGLNADANKAARPGQGEEAKAESAERTEARPAEAAAKVETKQVAPSSPANPVEPPAKPRAPEAAAAPPAPLRRPPPSDATAAAAPAAATPPTAAAPPAAAGLRKGKQPREVECLEALEEEVADALKQCTVSTLSKVSKLRGCSVMLDDFSVAGEAYTSRASCRFKASVSFTWDVLDPLGGFLGCQGRGEVRELCSEASAPPRVDIRYRAGAPLQARNAGEWMKEKGAQAIAECLSPARLQEAVCACWADLVEEEEEEAPARELSLPWAEAWLAQKMAGIKVTLFGGSASAEFPSAALTGDIAKALKVEIKWSIKSSFGAPEGLLVVEELTPETNAEKVDIDVQFVGKKPPGQLLTAFRQSGISAARSKLGEFVAEWRQRAQAA